MSNVTMKYGAKWIMCHPNAKGTGSALQLELHPAHDRVEGSLFARLVPQKTVGSFEGGVRILPTFDWDRTLTVRLDILELAQVQEVLRGYREKIADGNGLFHRTETANTVVTFEHRLEPVPGYVLSMSRKTVDGELIRNSFTLSMTEAIALSSVLDGAAVQLAFGVPQFAREEVA